MVDVREEVARTHVEMGARFAASAAQACAEAELVFTCLPGPPEVEAAVFGERGILHACRPGTVYVDLSSNSVSLARRIHAAMAGRGCPIVGDRKYGSSHEFSAGIGLHARRLVLPHPVRPDLVTVVAPLPASWRYVLDQETRRMVERI